MTERSAPILPSRDLRETLACYYVFVDDADSLYAEWEGLVQHDPATGSRIVAPVDTDYRMREFAVVDRSGNLMRVGSPLAA